MGLFEWTFKAHCDWKEHWYSIWARWSSRLHLHLSGSTCPQRWMLCRFCEQLAECRCVQDCQQSVIDLG